MSCSDAADSFGLRHCVSKQAGSAQLPVACNTFRLMACIINMWSFMDIMWVCRPTGRVNAVNVFLALLCSPLSYCSLCKSEQSHTSYSRNPSAGWKILSSVSQETLLLLWQSSKVPPGVGQQDDPKVPECTSGSFQGMHILSVWIQFRTY